MKPSSRFSKNLRFQTSTLSTAYSLPKSTSHHGLVDPEPSVWVWPPPSQFGFLLPSIPRSDTPPDPRLDCLAFPCRATFLSPLKISTSFKVRILLSPGISIRRKRAPEGTSSDFVLFWAFGFAGIGLSNLAYIEGLIPLTSPLFLKVVGL